MFYYKPKMKRYVVVDTVSKLASLANKMSTLEEFAFDTETNTLRVLGPNKDFRLVGISISWGPYHNYYIPVGHRRAEDIERNIPLEYILKYLKPIFEREDVRIIGQNLKFDLHVMARIGIYVKTKDLFDTMLTSWLCDETTPNGLKENSGLFLGLDQTHFKEVTDLVPKEVKKEFGYKANSKVTFDLTLITDAAPYALDDAFNAWELYQGFMQLIEEEKMDKIFYKVYIPFLRTLFDMEETGVVIDQEKLEQMKTEITKDKEELEYKLLELAGVKMNIGSNQQLAALLFGVAKDAPVEPWEDKKSWDLLDDGDRRKEQRKYSTLRDKWENDFCELLKVSFHFKPLSTTKTGAPQVNADTIWRLAHSEYKTRRKKEGVEFCKLLLDYKKLEKLDSAFIKGMSQHIYDDGKMHPSFNQIGTDSGRLSCSNPNVQQLPKSDEEDKYQIRSLFIGGKYEIDDNENWVRDVPEDYVSPFGDLEHIKRKRIITCDFSNLEVRMMAHFSKDEKLLSTFASGEDMHGSTAVNMFGLDCTPSEVKKKYPHLRQAGKVLNFLLQYGGGAGRLYDQLKGDRYDPVDLGAENYLEEYGCRTGIEVAQKYIDKYFDTYKGISSFMKNQKRYAHKYGYVYTILKRKRRLPDINGSDHAQVAYCERLAVNATIQGSAADLTMSAQNRIMNDPWFKNHGINMISQVHDEIIVECPEKYEKECMDKIKYYMEHALGDNVKLGLDFIADLGSGWSYFEAK